MRKERKIINTNIRLNLCDEQDRQAWEYLQTMDRKKYTYSCCVLCSDPYFCHDTGLPYFLGYLLQSENTG